MREKQELKRKTVRRFCIIYNGLVRGFKYEDVIQSHRKMVWSPLEAAGVEYDIFFVTNDIEYDDEAVQKIPRLKKKLVLDVEKQKSSEMFIKLSKLLRLRHRVTGLLWQEDPRGVKSVEFHNYIVSILNKAEIIQHIPKGYDRYLSMDIAQSIDELEPSILLSSEGTYSPGWGCYLGHNDRLLIGGYTTTYMYNNIVDYIVGRNKIPAFNPECLVREMFEGAGIKVRQPSNLRVTRVRANGNRVDREHEDAGEKTIEQVHAMLTEKISEATVEEDFFPKGL